MKLRLCDLADNIESAHIAEWKVAEASEVAEGQEILELVTDKASFAVNAPTGGLIFKKVKDGTQVSKDEIICSIKK